MRTGWPNYTFAFHDGEEIGPGLLSQIAKKTGLTPEGLYYEIGFRHRFIRGIKFVRPLL
jgi:hypothetical protein